MTDANDDAAGAMPYRVGLIVPSSNTTMETEIPEMLSRRRSTHPDRFTFHSSRARLHHVTPEELAAMVADGDRCGAELADAHVDVVAYACLVALMAQGPGYHVEAAASLGKVLEDEGAPAPVVTSAGALIAGLKRLGARSTAIVAPYLKPVTDLVVGYIEATGITVVDAHSFEISDNVAVGQIAPEMLLGALDDLNTSGADAVVLSACVQCPSLAAIPAAEEKLALPVLSAATATVYDILESLGLDPTVPDAGALLSAAHRPARVA